MASNTFRGLCWLICGPRTCIKLISLSSSQMFDSKYMFRGQLHIWGFSCPATISNPRVDRYVVWSGHEVRVQIGRKEGWCSHAFTEKVYLMCRKKSNFQKFPLFRRHSYKNKQFQKCVSMVVQNCNSFRSLFYVYFNLAFIWQCAPVYNLLASLYIRTFHPFTFSTHYNQEVSAYIFSILAIN